MSRYGLTVLFILSLVFLIQARQGPVGKNKERIYNDEKYKSGDIIFQTTTGGQSMAIILATHSIYTHVGMIFYENDIPYVYEAVQPVRKTQLDEWITHGLNKHYVVKRLINADSILTKETLNKMKQKFYSYINKDYDLYFGWSDEKLYCSELVWKLYKNATGMEIGALQHLKDFDLKSEVVKRKLEERYGSDIPYNELVVSPQSIFESHLIVTVLEE